MDNAVTYGICERRIADNVMPCIDRKLTGNESGPHMMSVFHDLKDVPSFFLSKWIYPPVIDDEELYSLEPLKKFYIAPVCFCYFQFPA